MANSGVALYVHLPFCLSRCSYCAFVSGDYDAALADAYIEALGEEIRRRGIFARERPSSLFIGGGTPSSLSLRQLEQLLSLLPFPASGGEATCEMNPDSADAEKLRLLAHHGITRCSFGVQTFVERGLRLLGRRHDAETAARAVEKALAAGFAAVNADFIMGWPGQEPAEWAADVERAAALGVRHLSCYNLMLEPGSALYATVWKNRKRNSSDNSADSVDDMDGEDAEAFGDEGRIFWDVAETVLAARGLAHYETSNYAYPGWECRHNVHIWQGGDYLGVGAAAHSYLGGRRFANMNDRERYIEAIRQGESTEIFSETLSDEARARECAVFWLRLFAGVDLAAFRERTGWDFFALYGETATRFLQQGYLALDAEGKRVAVPRAWQPVLDALLPDLV